jgi:hypothetical protein
VLRCAVLILATLAPGCDAQSSNTQSARAERVIDHSAAAPSLFGDKALEQALTSLMGAARPPVRALELSISSDGAILQAADRRRPGRVLQYQYRGGRLMPAVAVELRGSGKLEHNLFSLEAVNLATIPSLVKLAIERVDPQDGKVSEVVVRRNFPSDDSVRIRVLVKSPRRDGHLDADHTGKPLEPS